MWRITFRNSRDICSRHAVCAEACKWRSAHMRFAVYYAGVPIFPVFPEGLEFVAEGSGNFAFHAARVAEGKTRGLELWFLSRIKETRSLVSCFVYCDAMEGCWRPPRGTPEMARSLGRNVLSDPKGRVERADVQVGRHALVELGRRIATLVLEFREGLGRRIHDLYARLF